MYLPQEEFAFLKNKNDIHRFFIFLVSILQMPKIVHTENQIYYSEDDKNLSSAVNEVVDLIFKFGETNQQAIFRGLRKTINDKNKNYKYLEEFLRLMILIHSEEIERIIAGKTKMGAEIITHLAISKMEFN